MEEEKVVVVEEPKEEKPAVQENTKGALVAFILACVSVCVAAGWFIGAIAAIVLAAISLKKLKGLGEITQNPYRVFVKIAKPVAIVGLIFGILSVIGWTIWAIVLIVTVIMTAIEAAADAAIVVLL